MTIIEAKNIFDRILSELVGTGMEEYEFCELYNIAQSLRVKDDFRPNLQGRKKSGYEMCKYDSQNWSHLIVDFTSDCDPFLETDEKGRVFFEDIQNYFPDDLIRTSGYEEMKVKPDILLVSSILRFDHDTGQFTECKWYRHNTIGRAKRNPFRSPINNSPVYTIENGYYKIKPGGKTILEASVVRAPLRVYYDPIDITRNVDPEGIDQLVCDIIFRALVLAGVSIRDQQFYQMVKIEND